MALQVLNSVLDVLFNLLQWVIYAVIAFIVPIIFMTFVFFIAGLLRGKKIPRRKRKREFKYVQRFNPVRIFFWDLPRRIVADYFDRNPDSFDTYGVHLFCGEQGSGKSIAAVHFIKMMKERNPCSKLASNISLNFQDGKIENWSQILMQNNGTDGQIIFLDEMQNWFSSNESRNFPPAMLTEITQQRKQRKAVVGTSQVFTRVSKPIREQVTLLYKPMTILGCLTIVRVYKADVTEDGTVDKLHRRRVYCFVHDDELRQAYDTFEKVERYSLKGFQVPVPESTDN